MQIRTEQEFSVSPTELWAAISEHNQMINWFFENIPNFKAREGFETQFSVDTGDKKFIHHWTILEVVQGEKIVYDWKYPEYPGQGIVTFHIDNINGESKLTVTAEGMESFPQNIEEFMADSCQQGWDYFIKERLTKYLAE